MQGFKLCLLGYMTYIGLSSIFFIVDVLMGQGGSGKIFYKFWLLILILSSSLVFIGSTGCLFKILPKINKLILIISSILVTSLQIIILIFTFLFFAMFILAPILGRLGFYITMP